MSRINCAAIIVVMLLAMTGLSEAAQIQTPSSVANPKSDLKSVNRKSRYFLLMGQQLRQEKSVANEYETQVLKDLAIGFGIQDFNFAFESSTFSTNSGNATLAVSRSYESYALWAQYQVLEMNWGIPYLTIGAGASKESNTTQLYSESVEYRSPWQQLGGFGCGFRAPLPWIWVSAEARLVSAEGWNPSTSVYLLGRVGILF